MSRSDGKVRRTFHTFHRSIILEYFSGNLFKCLQAPLQDLRTWLRPNTASTTSASRPQRPNSPLAEREISFIDDSSVDSSAVGSNGSRNSTSSSSNSGSDDEAYPSTPVAEISLSSTNSSAPPTARAFSSDSGFVRITHLLYGLK